jgi:DNA-binding response OmpR family regulator
MPESKRAHILVVDRSQTLRNILSEAFEQAGWSVSCSQTCERGMKEASRRRPDIVVCDSAVIGASGIEMCNKIRETEAHGTVPFVFIASKDDTKAELREMSTGADRFVTRPVNTTALVDIVDAVLDQQHAASELCESGGRTETIPVSEVMLAAQVRRLTGRIDLDISDKSATVFVSDGDPHDAKFDPTGGTEALVELLTLEANAFSFVQDHDATPDRIKRSTTDALSHVLDLLHRRARLFRYVPARDEVLSSGGKKPAMGPVASALASMCDGSRTAGEITAESPLSDLHADVTFGELVAAGVVRRSEDLSDGKTDSSYSGWIEGLKTRYRVFDQPDSVVPLILVLGASGAGTTTFLRSLSGLSGGLIYGGKRFESCVLPLTGTFALHLLAVPGEKQFSCLWPGRLSQALGVIYLVDVADRNTWRHARFFATYAGNTFARPVLFCATKGESDRRIVELRLEANIPKTMPVVPISTNDTTEVREAFEGFLDLLNPM